MNNNCLEEYKSKMLQKNNNPKNGKHIPKMGKPANPIHKQLQTKNNNKFL